MVKNSIDSPTAHKAASYQLTFTLHLVDKQAAKMILTALEPEFPAINSKRVKVQVKPSRNQIVFHLTAQDVNALRAAATSLMRLYIVADGVHQLTVK